MSLQSLDRRVWARSLAVCLAAAGITAGSGCDPRQALYFLQPFEPKINAPCPSLKGKKVVILSTVVPGTGDTSASLDREIADGLARALREGYKKIEIVPYEEVAAWAINKPTWTDPTEAARAFDADVAILLEVREFKIQDSDSPGLFEGRSETHIKAVELAHPLDDRDRPILDRPKESRTIYEDDHSTAFPVTGHIALDSGVSPSMFRSTFLKLMVKEISWSFVDHAPGDNIQSNRFTE